MNVRPNILFLFPDQWRADCLSCAGHPVVETPFLDQLAAEGTRFTGAYTPSPTCIPARACLATGLTPSATGRLGYQDGVPWAYPDTFMRLLRDSGYQTMCSGKTHFFPQRARLGFEELALYEMPWQDYEHLSDYHVWLRGQAGGRIRDTGEDFDSNSHLARPWTHPEELHPSCWTTTAAIELLERRDPTRPFFLQVAWHRPHPPYDPPLSWFERLRDTALPPVPIGDWAAGNDRPVTAIDTAVGRLPSTVLDRTRRAYYAQISHLDSQIGRVMRYLKGRHLLDNTWIVFASDHGEMLGDHHLFRKTCPFESSARIPLIVKPPRSAAMHKGGLCARPVTLTDLMPTFLDLGGVAMPARVEGASLLPALRGDAPAGCREFIHGEHAPGWQFVTDGREKFIWRSTDGAQWFFDLESDPHECRNLVGDAAAQERVALWRGRLTGVLASRHEDGLVENGRLVAGVSLPSVRPRLLPATDARPRP